MQPARKPRRDSAPATPRSERLEARISADLKDLYQTLTDFVVSTVTDAAHRVVRENELLQWSRRDQQAFAAALLAPPAPSAKLTAAVAWSREQAVPNG